MSIRTRIAITGIGLISPIGNTPDTFLDALRTSQCGIRPVTAFDTSPFRTNLAGEIADFDPSALLSKEEIAEWNDRVLWLALSAARLAIRDAGLGEGFALSRDVGISAGTCNGGLQTAERLYRMLHGNEPGEVDERMNSLFRYFALGRALADAFSIGGPVHIVTTACASSTAALGLGADLIRSGRAHCVLAGGADALCLTAYSGFSGIKAMATGMTTPFSGGGDYGLNLGEGAAFWIIEDWDRAEKRGARRYGEFLDYGLSADAYHVTAPDPQGAGALRAMRAAMERSGVATSGLGYINPHGTGTEANDRSESRAIEKLLGESALQVPVSSTKSFFGHCLGAAGILEATASLLCMKAGFIPPTLHFTEPRPGCRLDYVPNHARMETYHTFLSNSMAFGGNNAAVCVTSTQSAPASQIKPPSHQRVVITGAGTVSPYGLDATSLHAGLASRLSAIQPISRFATDRCKSHCAGLVPETDWKRIDRRLNLNELELLSRFATLAARQCLDSAGLRITPKNCDAIGMILGVCVGPNEEALMNSVWGSPDRTPDLGKFSVIVANSVSGCASKELFIKGYNTVLSPGHNAGLAALIQAQDAIEMDHCDSIICGASDELFARYFYNYDTVGYLAHAQDELMYGHYTLPGSQRVLGEGAAAILLESSRTAEAAGRRIYADVLGSGMTHDPGPLLSGSISSKGLLAAIELAYNRAGIDPRCTQRVLTTPQGNETDRREQEAISSFFSLHDHSPIQQTTVYQTGYAEASSVLFNLCALIHPESAGSIDPNWMISGIVLITATSQTGTNYAVVLEVK